MPRAGGAGSYEQAIGASIARKRLGTSSSRMAARRTSSRQNPQRLDGRRAGCTLCDDASDAGGVAAHAVNHGRRHGVKEMQADEIESRLVGHDPRLVARLAARFEDRKLDEIETPLETCAPDDVGDVEHAAIGQDGQSLLHAFDTPDALDADR